MLNMILVHNFTFQFLGIKHLLIMWKFSALIAVLQCLSDFFKEVLYIGHNFQIIGDIHANSGQIDALRNTTAGHFIFLFLNF